MDKLLGCLGTLVAAIGILCVYAVIMAIPTYYLWNGIMPDITKEALTNITFWQALGLNFLCGILFKSSAASSDK